jgi:hypothetical protein
LDLEQREIVHRVVNDNACPEINRLAGNLYPNFLGILYDVVIGNDVTFLSSAKQLAVRAKRITRLKSVAANAVQVVPISATPVIKARKSLFIKWFGAFPPPIISHPCGDVLTRNGLAGYMNDSESSIRYDHLSGPARSGNEGC